MKHLLFLFLPLIAFADTVKDREGAVRSDREKMTHQDRWIYNDTDQAFAKAAREKKPVLVVLRCVPCLACAGLDGSITEAPALSPLLDKFVCLRLINTNSLDLNRFQFDYDLSLAALILNSDGTTYGRFGSWKHQKDPAESSIAGFKTALTSALALHKNYPSNKASLADKQPRPLGFETPLQIPLIATSQRNFKPELDWQGKVVQSCVRCHQIGDGLKSTFHDRGEHVPLRLSHPMPASEAIGISLAGAKRATITVVQPDSAAAKRAGFKKGDILIEVDGIKERKTESKLFGILLQRHPRPTQLDATVLRNGKRISLKFPFNNGPLKRFDSSR